MKFFKKYQFLILLPAVILFMTGCSTLPQTVYFQGDTLQYANLAPINPKVVKIEPNDILGVTITSISEEANKLFELPVTAGLRYTGLPNVQTSGMGMQPLGYEVDSLGFIELPLIGKVHVAKESCVAASEIIKEKLDKYLKSPSVNVRILNHKFTILGEVNRPATYNIIDNNVSIPEALGMAGDLTIYGKRDNILLVRKEGNARIRVRLNLLSEEILNSPYYYLKNGDVLYVQPSAVRSTTNDRSYQLLPIITSVVSAATSLGVLLLSLTR